MTEQEINAGQRKIKIPHSAIVRASGLLPMYYSTGELSIELEVPRKMIIQWIKNGLPHMRDEQNHVWVVGDECAVWIEAIRKVNLKKTALADGEAFCFRCQKPVEIQNRYTKTLNGRFLLSGNCPECGCKVNKGVKIDKPE